MRAAEARLRAFGTNPHLRAASGDVALEVGRASKAIALYGEAAAADPTYMYAWAQKAKVEFDKGDISDALATIAAAKDAAASAPVRPWGIGDVVAVEVDLLLALDRIPEAGSVLRRYAAPTSEPPRITDRLRAAEINVRRVGRDFEGALDLVNERSRGYFEAIAEGWLRVDLRQHHRALRSFDSAHKLRPRNVEPVRGIAIALRGLGRPAEAASRLAQFVDRLPPHRRVALQTDLGWAYLAAGQLRLADKRFREAWADRRKAVGTGDAPDGPTAAARGLLAVRAALGDTTPELLTLYEGMLGTVPTQPSADASIARHASAELMAEWAAVLIRRDDIDDALVTIDDIRNLQLGKLARLRLGVRLASALIDADHPSLAERTLDRFTDAYATDPEVELLRAELLISERDFGGAYHLLGRRHPPAATREFIPTAVRLLRARCAANDSILGQPFLELGPDRAHRSAKAARGVGFDLDAGDLLLAEARQSFAVLDVLRTKGLPTTGRHDDAAAEKLTGIRRRCAQIQQRERTRTVAARTDALLSAILGDTGHATQVLQALSGLVDAHELAYDRAVVLILDRRYQEAIDQLEHACGHDSLSRHARHLLGICCQELDQLDAAHHHYEAARRQGANHAEIARSQALLLAEQGRDDAAVENIDRCLDNTPTTATVELRITRAWLIGNIAQRQEDKTARRDLYFTALDDLISAERTAALAKLTSRYEGEIAYQRGMIYGQLPGRGYEARRELTRAADASPPARAAILAQQRLAIPNTAPADTRLRFGGNVLMIVGGIIVALALTLGVLRAASGDADAAPPTSNTAPSTTTPAVAVQPTTSTQASTSEPPTTATAGPPSADGNDSGTTTTSAAPTTTAPSPSADTEQRPGGAQYPSYAQLFWLLIAGVIVMTIGAAFPRITTLKGPAQVEFTVLQPVERASADTAALSSLPLLIPDPTPLVASTGIYRGPAPQADLFS